MPPKKPTIQQPFSVSKKTLRSPARNPKPQKEEYNCRSCDAPDSAGNMVQCDQCSAWDHFSCAGVDSFIQDVSYLCKKCTGKSMCLANISEAYTASAVRFVDINADMHSKSSRAPSATTTAAPFSATNSIDESDVRTGPVPATTTPTNPAKSRTPSTTNTAEFALSAVPTPAPTAAEVAAMCRNLAPATTSLANFTPYPYAMTSVQTIGALPHLQPNAPTIYGPNVQLASAVSTGQGSTTINAITTPRIVTSTAGSNTRGQFTNNSLPRVKEKSTVPVRVPQPPRSRSSTSSISSKLSTKRMQIELQRVEEELQLRKERDAEYLNKKYLILSQAIDSSGDEDESVPEAETATTAQTNVDNWVDGIPEWDCLHSTTSVCAHPPAFVPPSYQHTSRPWASAVIEPPVVTLAQPSQSGFGPRPPLLQHDRERSTGACPSIDPHQPLFVPLQNLGQAQVNFQLPSHNTSTNRQPTVQTSQPWSSLHTSQHEFQNNHLTKNHLAARHLMSRDLPSFDGNPAEWPLFIASFNRSTSLGGFVDEENLIRLHKALKGDALEAVRSLIIQPNCVRRVIETLRMLFGRPELIINTLLRTIARTPPPKADKLETIVTFAIAVQNLCATIEASGLVDHLNNPMLVQDLVEKLPPTLRLNWAIHKQTLPTCTLLDFSSWLYRMAEAANGVLVSVPSGASGEEKRHRNKNWKDKGLLNVHNEEAKIHKCCICGGKCASVADCKQFQQLSRTAKWEEVKKHQLCRRCLARHLYIRCKVESVCGKNNCVLKHHQLLHNDRDGATSSPSTTGTVGLHHENKTNNTDPILFRIVPVILYGRGVEIKAHALLDDGSSVTLMDKEIAKQLKVQGEPRPLCLKWTGNTSRYESNSELIDLQISSTNVNAERFPLTDVHTVEGLRLPPQTINSAELQRKFEHLKGIAINSYERAVPRLLIGVNNAQLGLPLRSREGGRLEPVATKTRLGWVVHGNCTESDRIHRSDGNPHSFHICECSDLDLQRLVKNFICDDNFGASNTQRITMSQDDSRALDLLSRRTIRKDGRFETTLLWKFDTLQLPDSYPMARKRLICLQKRMERDKGLAEVLNRKIEEYVLKGYARKVTPQEISDHRRQSWYLPIFPVENPNKPGKVRIVWDAAAETHGTSLNSVLLKGPDQLTPLMSVIFKFRQQRIAICGDIMEMFHQIVIRKEDQHYQRFLWGCNEEGTPDTYIMMVMTFGATCSPCTAHFIKNTNAEHFAAEFPRAAQSIKENHYVDDLMDSVPTEEDAIQLAREVRHIHQQGGFHIRNWVSNSSSVLRALNSEPTDKVNMNINVELGTEKVLGMWWCTDSDCFTFKITANPKQEEILFGSRRPTKREVLRVLMTIFDPLGLIAFFLMYIKILLQEIWRSKIEWDDEIKDEENAKWRKWVQHLPKVETVKIPRCYVTSTWGSEIQLHVFVDASENGFAAVAYIRNLNGTVVETSLVGAKTRVAPLKSQSVPRLELQAALLGARLAKSITKSHDIRFTQQYFWSDSKTVLCWLRSDHRRYRQYVAFRVSEIMELTEITDWRWIPTKINVADDATKWQRHPEFKSTSRWFNGPEFLKSPPEDWPQESIVGSTTEELRTHFVGVHISGHDQTLRFNEISSWTKLLRSTAYVFRFVHNMSTKRTKEPKLSGPLAREELQMAENALVREAQKSVYAEEVADLEANRQVEKTSTLSSLCPFLDKNGLIRANGRIRFAKGVSEDLSSPIILPKSHTIASHIIKDFHQRYKHQNDETVVNAIRQKFYIAQMRSALKVVKRSCQRCKNARTQPRSPIMAQLPPARLASFSRPFSYVGVDYFGPMTVIVGRRTEKRWGVLFTCLTTRAVHIEVAHTLTTDSCILCLRNFMARRGTPIEFHSDNGTNFHGAERELREATKMIKKDKLVEAVTTTITKWKFIPPGSPHMGGSWERLVRSIKTVLYASTPTRNPNDELLRSMLIEAEGILNARPLTYMPIDAENPEALTPNHFLLGSASGLKPLVDFNDDVRVLRSNWLISQQFAGRFWKRWVAEYLPTLTRRAKWFTPVKPLEVGDIVLIVDPNNPRNCWPKGRVVEVKRSQDGQVRSAYVQTQNGIYERPVVKLAVLDVQGPEDISPPVKLPQGSVGESANAP